MEYKDKHIYTNKHGFTSEIYLIDCMLGMQDFEDKYFDLALVDPPYGSENIKGGYTSGKGGGIAKQKQYHDGLWQYSSPDYAFFLLLKFKSQNQIIWGANHFISQMQYNDSSCWLVWDKKNGKNRFADCELAYTSYEKATRIFAYRWSGMLQENMKNKEHRIHPTQKPIALYDWIYKNYLPNGGKVLDTHLGSSTNRISADKQGNIHFTGFEIDSEYFYSSIKRFEQYTRQETIF